MRRRSRSIRGVAIAALLGVLVTAPAAAAGECDDRARVLRELIGRYVAERARGEVEIATEMARLKKELQSVTDERDAARAKLKDREK